MPLYDLMLLLDPGAPSDRQESILRDVQGLLEKGGTVVGNYDWGSRRMTFEIDHRPEAAYHLFQFETESGGALLEQVDHSLKIMDGVLRHRIIRLKDGAPAPPMPQPDRRGGYPEGYDAPDAPPVAPDAAAAPVDGEAPVSTGEPAAPAEADAASAPEAPVAAAEEPAAAPAEAEAPAADSEGAAAEAEPAAEEPAAAEPEAGAAEPEAPAAEADPVPAGGDDDAPAAA